MMMSDVIHPGNALVGEPDYVSPHAFSPSDFSADLSPVSKRVVELDIQWIIKDLPRLVRQLRLVGQHWLVLYHDPCKPEHNLQWKYT